MFHNESRYNIHNHATKPHAYRQRRLTELPHLEWNLLNNFAKKWTYLLICLGDFTAENKTPAPALVDLSSKARNAGDALQGLLDTMQANTQTQKG